jgi:hypothetical protein
LDFEAEMRLHALQVLRPTAHPVRTAGLFLILACAQSLTVLAQTPLEDNPASAIRALEHAWVVGQSSNNNQALNLVFDNALVYVEYGKLVTKGEYLSRVRTVKPHASQIVMEVLTVHMFGGTAIVVGTYRDKKINAGKTSLGRWRFLDTWVYKKGRWMLVAAAASPSSK